MTEFWFSTVSGEVCLLTSSSCLGLSRISLCESLSPLSLVRAANLLAVGNEDSMELGFFIGIVAGSSSAHGLDILVFSCVSSDLRSEFSFLRSLTFLSRKTSFFALFWTEFDNAVIFCFRRRVDSVSER